MARLGGRGGGGDQGFAEDLAARKGLKLTMTNCTAGRTSWTSIRDALTFRLAKEDPWLEGQGNSFGDDFVEEQRLAHIIAHDEAHARATRHLNRLFVLSTAIMGEGKQLRGVKPRTAIRESETGLDPATNAGQTSGPGPRNRIEFDLSWGQLRANVNRLRGSQVASEEGHLFAKCVSLAVMALMSYITFMMIFSAKLLIQHDTIMTNMKPTLRPNASETLAWSPSSDGPILCALREDIEYGTDFSWAKLREANKQLDSHGVPIKSQLGVTFIATAIIVSAPFVFYSLPALFMRLASARIRLDAIAFLYEPVRERARLQHEQRRIMHELVETFEWSFSTDAARLEPPRVIASILEISRQIKAYLCQFQPLVMPSPPPSPPGELRHAKVRQVKNSGKGTSLGQLLSHESCLKQRLMRRAPIPNRPSPSKPDSVEFLQILDEVMKGNLVRPVIVCSQWHFDLQRWIAFMVPLFFGISSISPHAGTLFSTAFEIVLQALERHKVNRCAGWHPRGVVFKPAYYLEPPRHRDELFRDRREREEYEKLFTGDNNIAHLLYLALVYETSHYLTWPRATYSLLLGLMVFFLAFWSTFWTSIFMLCFMDKIAWLHQIRAQLTCCYRQMAEQVLLSDLSEGRPNDSAPRAQARESDESDKAKEQELFGTKLVARTRHKMHENQSKLLLKRLTIVYVNHQLFRRQFKPFRKLSNFLVFQAIAFSAAAFIELYLVVTNVETQFKFFAAFSSAFVLAFLNVILLVASYASKLIESNVHLLLRLIGLISNYRELENKPIVRLWYRQPMSAEEIRMFASTKILNLHITYKQMVAFNVQLLGVWLLLYRVFGRQH